MNFVTFATFPASHKNYETFVTFVTFETFPASHQNCETFVTFETFETLGVYGLGFKFLSGLGLGV